MDRAREQNGRGQTTADEGEGGRTRVNKGEQVKEDERGGRRGKEGEQVLLFIDLVIPQSFAIFAPVIEIEDGRSPIFFIWTRFLDVGFAFARKDRRSRPEGTEREELK